MVKTGWKNKGGTSDRHSCTCGAWKDHWLNITKEDWPEKCSVEGCDNPAEDGAHVWNEKEKGEYIVPFCKECNDKGTDVFFNLKDITFASANLAETCGKTSQNLQEALKNRRLM